MRQSLAAAAGNPWNGVSLNGKGLWATPCKDARIWLFFNRKIAVNRAMQDPQVVADRGCYIRGKGMLQWWYKAYNYCCHVAAV